MGYEAEIPAPVVKLHPVAVIHGPALGSIDDKAVHEDGSTPPVHEHVRDRITVGVKMPPMGEYARSVLGINLRPRTRRTIAPA